MNTPNAVNPGLDSGQVVYPASARTAFRVAIADLTATAATATVLLNPLTFTGVSAQVIPLGPRSTRVIVRGRVTSATTAVATSPVVRLYAFAGDPSDLTTCTPIGRVDADTWTAAGLTLTFDATPSATDMFTNTNGATTYRYTNTLPTASTGVGYDCLGASFIVALTETAASITDGACALEIGVMN